MRSLSSQPSHPTPLRAAVPGNSKLAQFERRLQAREQEDGRVMQMVANQADTIARLETMLQQSETLREQHRERIQRLEKQVIEMRGLLEVHNHALFDSAEEE